ncbi:MAG: hypothetical protein H0U85_08980 [Gemmatimonadales bacterium]|nr:hypothetical protein [Gemmatimonadales bacterium]
MRNPESRSDPVATPAAERTFEPRHPTLVAVAAYVIVVVTLCWPLFQGRFLGGTVSDQYSAGYSFRLFGAEMFRATGSIPLWNPYLFGGMPFVGAMHGDIFYPTAWLRWIMPVGTAMGLGFALHLALAGLFMYLLLRALRVGWTAAFVGGLVYELTGILASLVHPGHDGKLFVSALTPLLFLALVRAVRDGRLWGFGLVAMAVGLCLLSPHPQMSYYAFLAAGVWTLYLLFGDPDGPRGARWSIRLAMAAGAVLLGVAIAAIQLLPFLHYMPYSARAVATTPDIAWQYATSYALPIEELMTTFLPQFNGVGESYWGQNFFKLHSEYLGVLVIILAIIGAVDRRRRRTVWALGGIAVFFLLVALGAHTPFYRLWYEVMPGMKKVRAPGMAFFLVAMPTAIFAAFGVDRLMRRDVRPVRVLLVAGVFGLIALLGIAGVLQSMAAGIADPRMAQQVAANEPALTSGSLRLLLFVLAGGAAFWAVATGRLRGAFAAAVIALLAGAELWSFDRDFFVFGPPAEQLFGDDPITARLRQEQPPFRVFDVAPQSVYPVGPVYHGSFLMAKRIQTAFGYHGNEERFVDELWGGKNQYRNMTNAAVWDLWAVRFVMVQDTQPIPGFRRVLGPVQTVQGASAVLYERDTTPAYARVVGGAAKLPEDQIVPTLIDARFPMNRVVVYSESASVAPPPIRGALPAPATATARVTSWAPGHMKIALDGKDTRTTYLLVSESWYPDWRATVDGKATPTLRGDFALISVPLPPGASAVSLDFVSSAYATGRLLTLAAALATAALVLVPLWRERRFARAVLV